MEGEQAPKDVQNDAQDEDFEKEAMTRVRRTDRHYTRLAKDTGIPKPDLIDAVSNLSNQRIQTQARLEPGTAESDSSGERRSR